MYKMVIFLICFWAIQGCKSGSQKYSSISEFVKETSGEQYVKESGNYWYNITFKLLTTDAQVLLDWKSKNKKLAPKEIDSLRNMYNQALYFEFEVDVSEKNTSTSVMSSGVKSVQDYKNKALTLNFELKDKFKIVNKEGEALAPVLANIENTYDLGSSRKMQIVFEAEALHTHIKKDEHIDVVFMDEIFETGIHHFVFNKSTWTNSPKINFEKLQ